MFRTATRFPHAAGSYLSFLDQSDAIYMECDAISKDPPFWAPVLIPVRFI